MSRRTTYEIVAKTKGFKKSEKQVGGLKMALGGLSRVALKVGGFVTLVDGSRRAAKAFATQELAVRKLGQALGGSSTRLLEQAAALQKVSTSGDEAIIAQQAFLAAIGMTEDQIVDIIPVALDLAAATGLTLESAVRNTAKTFSGLAGELGELVPQVRELSPEAMKAGEAVKVMGELFGGAASTEAATLSGRLTRVCEVMGDIAENVGSKPALTIDGLLLKFLELNGALTEQEQKERDIIQVQKELDFVQGNIEANRIGRFETTQELLDKEIELENELLEMIPTRQTALQEEHDQMMFNIADEVTGKELLTDADKKLAEQEKERAARAKRNAKMRLDAENFANTGMLGSLSALNDAVTGNAGVTKNLTIAQAVADTFAGANSALREGTGVMRFVEAAAIITAGTANVVQIQKAYERNRANVQSQYGFEGVVDEPTQFTVGEGGAAEYVSVQPMEGVNNAGGGGININISGNVMSEDFVENELAEKISEAVRKGVSFGMS